MIRIGNAGGSPEFIGNGEVKSTHSILRKAGPLNIAKDDINNSVYLLRTVDDKKVFYIGETTIGIKRNLQQFKFAASQLSCAKWRHKYAGKKIEAIHMDFKCSRMDSQKARREIEALLINYYKGKYGENELENEKNHKSKQEQLSGEDKNKIIKNVQQITS